MQDLFDQFDEAQLLAFVEGELDPEQQRSLLTRLESNPQAKKAILQMCANREAMRSIDEPLMPYDFLAELEPQLARPMLIDPSPVKPGESRRKHRQALRQKQWPRMAAAAILFLAVSGGIWASSGFIMDGLSQLASSTRNETPDPATLNPAQAELDDSSQLAFKDPTQAILEKGGVLHHYHPQVTSIEAFAFADLREGDEDVTIESTEIASASLPSLALFIEADHEALVEKTLRDLIPEFSAQAAFVRNFSPTLKEPESVVFRRPTINPNARAAKNYQVVPNQRLPKLASDELYQPMRLGQSEGDSSLSPNRKTQTRYADMGASHTFSIRKSHLNEVLARLGRSSDFQTQLEMFQESDTEFLMADASMFQRFQQRRSMQNALKALLTRNDDLVVTLPIMVKQRNID